MSDPIPEQRLARIPGAMPTCRFYQNWHHKSYKCYLLYSPTLILGITILTGPTIAIAVSLLATDACAFVSFVLLNGHMISSTFTNSYAYFITHSTTVNLGLNHRLTPRLGGWLGSAIMLLPQVPLFELEFISVIPRGFSPEESWFYSTDVSF